MRYHARLYGHSRTSARAVCREAARSTSASADRRSLADRRLQPRHAPAPASRSRARQRALRSSSSTSRPLGSTRPASGRSWKSSAGSRREHGATVLLSTHLLDEVEEVCSRVLILNRGRVVCSRAPSSEVARRAAAPRSARAPRRLPTQVERAVKALAGASSIEAGGSSAYGLPGSLVCQRSAATASEATVNGGLRALADAGVPVARVRARGRTPERCLPRDDGGPLR